MAIRQNLNFLRQQEANFAKNPSSKQATNAFFSPGKKNQPPTTKAIKAIPLFILGSFVLLALTFTFIVMTPSLLINHVAQTITDAFNYQAPSLETRSNTLLSHKAQADLAPSKYKIINNYRTTSDPLAKNLEQMGFNITVKDQRMQNISYQNQSIDPANLLEKLETNPEINEAKNTGLNLKRLAFQDEAWLKNAKNLKLKKRGFSYPKDKTTAEIKKELARQETALTKVAESGMRFSTDTPTTVNDQGQEVEDNSASANLFKNVLSNLKYINDQADNLSKNHQTPYQKSFNNLEITDSSFIDKHSVCGLYHNVNFQEHYAKFSQSKQQSQLALNFLVEAEKIKAGHATPESTAFYGDRLTQKFTVEKNGQSFTTEAATDSQGYKYIAYGDTSPLVENTERYVLGASPSLSMAQKEIADSTAVCEEKEPSKLKNLFSDFFTNLSKLLQPTKIKSDFLVSFLDSGQNRKITENTLAAMANQKISPETAGEDLGNALVSGAGYFMGKNAAIGGNGLLTKKQAIAYLNHQKSYLAKQDQISIRQLGHFNPYHKQTFLGKVFSLNLSWSSRFSSVSNLGSGLINSIKNSLALISPISQASSDIKTFNNLSQCKDSKFLSLNKHLRGEEVALDIFCNPIYGVSMSSLKINPETVITTLIDSGNLKLTDETCQNDCELTLANDLEKYQKNCINRARLPLGDSEEDQGLDDGESCLLNTDIKALFPIYFIDQRLQKMFDKVE